MQIIENIKLKEKLYVEKLENGLTIMILPRKTTQKKYAMWGVNFGSIDNHLLIQIISYEKKANFSCDCSQLYFFGNSPK